MRQPVNEEQGNLVYFLSKRPAVARRCGDQIADDVARRDRIEHVDILETVGGEVKAVCWKSDRGKAVLVIAAIGQLPRTGATDDRHAFATPVDGPRQRIPVEPMRAEQHEASQRRFAKLLHDLVHGGNRARSVTGCKANA